MAAVLLLSAGYEVFGAFMKNWSLDIAGVYYKPWEDEAEEAAKVCRHLGIDFKVFDFEEEYQKRVVDEFVREYSVGRTPNPDVLCNREIKFDLFLNRAKKMGADGMATGHYARTQVDDDRLDLLAGVDPEKDQSYFLYTLTQKELADVKFPIGHLRKYEVREIACDHHLPNAEKKDSQGICFIGPVSMRNFLQHYLKIKPGPVITPEGTAIGQHDGVIFYTEGQRHGFGSGGNHEPLYVAEKRLESNELVVAPKNSSLLYTRQVVLESPTWIDDQPYPPITILTRVRYRQPLVESRLINAKDRLVLQFANPIFAVSPGQAAVFYNDDKVLGGAVIAARVD